MATAGQTLDPPLTGEGLLFRISDPVLRKIQARVFIKLGNITPADCTFCPPSSPLSGELGRDPRPREPTIHNSHLCVSEGVALTQDVGQRWLATPWLLPAHAGPTASPPDGTRGSSPRCDGPREGRLAGRRLECGMREAPPATPTPLDPYRTGARMAELIKAEFQV